MSQPRSPPGTGPASNAGARTRSSLPKNGAKYMIARRHTPRRWTTCARGTLRGRVKRLHRRNIDELPDGVFATFDGAAFAIRGCTLLHWTPDGYDARQPRPRRIAVEVLTPPATIGILSAGYELRWH